MFTKEIPAEFYAPVEKLITEDLMPGFSAMVYNEAAIVMYLSADADGKIIPRSDEAASLIKKVVNFCSDGYGLVPNDAIFPLIEERFKLLGYTYEVSYKVNNLAKFFIEYLITNEKITINGDILQPVIRLQHSYNSKMLYGVSFGFNTSEMSFYGMNSTAQFQISHCVGNVEPLIEKTVTSMSDYVINFKDIIIEEMNELSGKISGDEVEEFVENVIAKTNFLKLKDSIIETIKVLNKKSSIISYWNIYKSFVWELYQNNTMQEDFKLKLDKKVFDTLTNIIEE
jgi:hypothetical protein